MARLLIVEAALPREWATGEHYPVLLSLGCDTYPMGPNSWTSLLISTCSTTND